MTCRGGQRTLFCIYETCLVCEIAFACYYDTYQINEQAFVWHFETSIDSKQSFVRHSVTFKGVNETLFFFDGTSRVCQRTPFASSFHSPEGRYLTYVVSPLRAKLRLALVTKD